VVYWEDLRNGKPVFFIPQAHLQFAQENPRDSPGPFAL